MNNKKDIDSIHPLVMAEEYWVDSPLSLARYYGQIQFGGNLFGEPADLCLAELVPVYKWLGRDEFLKRIKEGVKASELLAEYKARKKGGKK